MLHSNCHLKQNKSEGCNLDVMNFIMYYILFKCFGARKPICKRLSNAFGFRNRTHQGGAH